MSELENETAGLEERLLEVRAHFELVAQKAGRLAEIEHRFDRPERHKRTVPGGL